MSKPVPGPDRNPRPPRLRLPEGACDCHMHVFGPKADFAFDPDRHYTPPDCLVADYLAMRRTVGLSRSVVVQPSVYGFDNRCTAAAIAALGATARGVAVVPPDAGAADLRALAAQGFRGTRFNLVQTGGSATLDALERTARLAAEVGWHLQVYMRGTSVLEGIAARLVALPVPVVLDHMGGMDGAGGVAQSAFQTLLRLVGEGRVYVKLSGPYRAEALGPPYPVAATLARALVAANPERLVWGSDWPHPDVPGPEPGGNGPMPNDGDLVDLLDVWAPDADARRRILVDNPARLYGFAA